MNERDFQDRVDEIFSSIEDQLDELPFELDIDTSGGVLNVAFPDGSAIVLSRQVANREIWVAARSGGFHLGHDGETWFCRTTSETFTELVNRVFSEHCGTDVVVLP